MKSVCKISFERYFMNGCGNLRIEAQTGLCAMIEKPQAIWRLFVSSGYESIRVCVYGKWVSGIMALKGYASCVLYYKTLAKGAAAPV